MDILKVLSRGTKQAPRKPGLGSVFPTAVNLPSAGTRTNPQLFHDPVGQTSTKSNRKRKRGGSAARGEAGHGDNEADSEASVDASLSEIDFFASKEHTKAEEATTKKAQSQKTSAKEKTTKAKRKIVLLDEDECHRILRSHRLKLTVLSDKKARVEAEPEKKKKKKKSKKNKEEEKAASKDDKKPLVPQPLTSFAQLRHTYNVSPRLADNLERLDYRMPTEVQMGSLPLLLDPVVALSKTTGVTLDSDSFGEGIDFLAVAPTGSGKTLSFLVPAINSILKRRAAEKAAGGGSEDDEAAKKKEHILDTVVVVPTRELARQIAEEGKKLAVGTGVRVVAMRKGMQLQSAEGDDEDAVDSEESDDEASEEDDEEAKTKTSKKSSAATATKADVLVTTPLMLLHALGQEIAGDSSDNDNDDNDNDKAEALVRKTLPTVRTLVLDEADVLLDGLFREQTLGIWKACTHPELRSTFWSATMASSAEALVAQQLAAQHGTAARRPALVRLVVGLKDAAVPNVAHRLVYTATEQGKLLAMRQLLHPSTSVSVTGSGSGSGSGSSEDGGLRPPFLVFAQTAERATALHDELQYDIPAAAGGAARLGVLHAGLSDAARAAVVRQFRAGTVWVLIATDVLARGIDFAGVNGVVNYDVPTSAAAYVHRAGRTGRAGRQGGLVVTLYTKEDIPFVKSVANVIAASEKQQQQKGGSGIQQWLLDALPQVTKDDKKRLKARGVESRRSTTSGGDRRSQITSKSAWERRRENNRRDAIASSKRRKRAQQEAATGTGTDNKSEEWGGFD